MRVAETFIESGLIRSRHLEGTFTMFLGYARFYAGRLMLGFRIQLKNLAYKNILCKI